MAESFHNRYYYLEKYSPSPIVLADLARYIVHCHVTIRRKEKTMRIMIVDDNEGMRDVLKNMLGGVEVEFCECEDGGQAISQYSQFSPDWVLMDVSMAYVDGISALSELKAMFPEARVVIVTDYDDQAYRQQAKEAGADWYVLKEHLHDLRTVLA
jgi:DNA-binding NarL/FixJ family response regulator